MSKVDFILLQDEDEKFAPPDQSMLKLAYVREGNGQPGIVFFNVVKAGKFNQKTKDHDLELLGSVAVNIRTFKDALALLESHS